MGLQDNEKEKVNASKCKHNWTQGTAGDWRCRLCHMSPNPVVMQEELDGLREAAQAVVEIHRLNSVHPCEATDTLAKALGD